MFVYLFCSNCMCILLSGRISMCLETMRAWYGMKTWCMGIGQVAQSRMAVGVLPWTLVCLRYVH